MTAGQQAIARPADRLSQWCGWVTVGGLVLAPPFAWLWPMGFTGLLCLMGALCLPALRVTDEDRPAAVLLLLILVWAAMSAAWSPFHPSKANNNTALKLALQLPLYWSAYCGARRADPGLKRLALKVLAWGTALLALVLLAEFATDAAIYERLHVALYEPIRHDLAEVNVAHSTFILMLLAPLAFGAGLRTGATPWLALLMIAGAVAPGLRFKAEAPTVAAVVAVSMFLGAWRWSRAGPRILAAGAAIYVLGAPLVILGLRAAGVYEPLQRQVEESWSMRLSFWAHAVDWLKDHPIRGWGLDASRTFGPGIILHPHDGALQVWLELGAVGAVLCAAFWVVTLRRLERPLSNVTGASVTAAAAVYLLFGALNFGAWQEWWLALGALVAVGGVLLAGAAPSRRAARAST